MTVRVYKNLHKDCYSVQKKTPWGWRLHRHVEEIILRNPTFEVSEAGRVRVLSEGRKNVHAFVHGEPVDVEFERKLKRISYDPYRCGSFFWSKSGKPVTENLPLVLLDETGVWTVAARCARSR